MTLFDNIKQAVRNSDPQTSVKGAVSVVVRKGSQKNRLLAVYALYYGITDEEAGDISGLSKKPRCCYWKRCSELRQEGLIKPTGKTWKSSCGEDMQTCEITPAGIETLHKLTNQA